MQACLGTEHYKKADQHERGNNHVECDNTINLAQIWGRENTTNYPRFPILLEQLKNNVNIYRNWYSVRPPHTTVHVVTDPRQPQYALLGFTGSSSSSHLVLLAVQSWARIIWQPLPVHRAHSSAVEEWRLWQVDKRAKLCFQSLIFLKFCRIQVWQISDGFQYGQSYRSTVQPYAKQYTRVPTVHLKCGKCYLIRLTINGKSETEVT